MDKLKSRLVVVLLILVIIFPVIITSAIPVAYGAEVEVTGSKNQNQSWVKGILMVLLSYLVNHFTASPEKVSRIDEKPLIDVGNVDYKREVMGFYVNWLSEDTSSYESLQENSNNVNMVAPFWYTVNPDGTIESRYGGHQYEVASLARSSNLSRDNNLMILPLVNNNQQNNMILVNQETRDKAVKSIVKLVEENGYDGVNIDFEGLPSWTRDGYTAFIKQLSTQMRKKRKVLTISVFPKIGVPLSMHGAYDYSALAPYVDRVVIMLYDNHWSTGPAGPIAPIKWVEDNIKYALEYLPASKILLGIANYGYDWAGDGLGESISAKRAYNIAADRGAELLWDDESKSPYFYYWDDQKAKHEVWFENSYSLEFKLKLVNKYNLKGVAIWRLGNENNLFWQTLENDLI